MNAKKAAKKKTRRGEKNRELERKNNAHDFVNCIYK